MGGLRKYMPITYWTAVVGSLALAGIPPFAGFFSKDAIIEAVHASSIPGHGYAYFAVMAGVFITAFYSFRMLFLAFHGRERMADGAHDHHDAGHGDDHGDDHGHDHGPPVESPWVVTVPLILLAIPSVYAGWAYIEPMVIGTYFGDSIVIRPEHAAIAELRAEWHGIGAFMRHGMLSLPFWLAVAGIVSAWYCYLVNPALPDELKRAAGPIYTLLDQKYYFDRFNDWFFAGGARGARPLPVDGRRPHDHRRLLRQRHGARRRLGRLAHAAHAVGLCLSLRLHDDPRRVRAPDLVDPVSES